MVTAFKVHWSVVSSGHFLSPHKK